VPRPQRKWEQPGREQRLMEEILPANTERKTGRAVEPLKGCDTVAENP